MKSWDPVTINHIPANIYCPHLAGQHDINDKALGTDNSEVKHLIVWEDFFIHLQCQIPDLTRRASL